MNFRNSLPLLLLLLSACGFSPVYGSHDKSGDKGGDRNGSVAERMNEVALDNIPDRIGQVVRNDLIDRMYGKGRPKQPLYSLHVDLTLSVQDLGIQADATSTRALMDLVANYALTEKKKGTVVLSGTAHSISSFNKLLNQYGTLAASEGAQGRTANEVTEQIVNRLNLFFSEGPQKPDATSDTLPPERPSPAVTAPGNAALPSGFGPSFLNPGTLVPEGAPSAETPSASGTGGDMGSSP